MSELSKFYLYTKSEYDQAGSVANIKEPYLAYGEYIDDSNQSRHCKNKKKRLLFTPGESMGPRLPIERPLKNVIRLRLCGG